MKYCLLLCSFLLLTACGERNEGLSTTALMDGAQPKEVLKLNGKEIPVYDFKGFRTLLEKQDEYTYIVNFWATWCAPCIKELPYFERIRGERENAKLRVVLVSLDMPKMWASHLLPFVEERGLSTHVMVLDDPKQHEWIPQVDPDWSGAIPATLIYNKEKKKFYEKPFTYEELQRELNSFIKPSAL